MKGRKNDMNPNRMRQILAGEYEIVKESEKETCIKMDLDNGAIVNVFNTGTYNVQGKPAQKEEVESFIASKLTEEDKKLLPTRSTKKSNKIFVVYGHDTNVKNELEALLRRWNFEPIILANLPSEGKTIIEKLETYTECVNYGIVLATPDDEGHICGKEDERMCRCRQNVVLELGMLLAALGRERVAILLKEPNKMERPSDIHGLMYIPFEKNIEEAKTTLAKELETKLSVSITASQM